MTTPQPWERQPTRNSQSLRGLHHIPGRRHKTQPCGPPLAHVVPTFSQLTSADIEIVNYLQDHGLWRHNVNNPNARKALNDSTLTANNNRLAHVVKWMKRYGDTPPHGAESRAESKKPLRAESGTESEAEKGKTLVSEGESQRKATEKTKLGKGNIGDVRGDTPN